MKLTTKHEMPAEHTEPWFLADFQCESCGEVEVRRAIDEEHFTNVVTPAIPCPKCGKTSQEVSAGNATATDTTNTEENA